MTRALDVVTIMYALANLGKEIGSTGWQPNNKQQQRVIGLMETHAGELDNLTSLEALASRSYQELNTFLTDHKFKPVVDPFDPAHDVGVVSILDKLVKWLHGPGDIITINTSDGSKPGFELPALGVNIYSIEGSPDSHLLELLTKSDDTLWLLSHYDETISGIDMVELAIKAMSAQRRSNSCYAGAKIPMLDFEIDPDIGWMNGATTTDKHHAFYGICQAKQQFKMHMHETGARVKVATSMATYRCSISKPVPFVVDKPFYGWWTQKGFILPMAVFFADFDAMKKPAGSLEDL